MKCMEFSCLRNGFSKNKTNERKKQTTTIEATM